MSEQWMGLHNPERHSQFEVGGGVVCDRCWTGDHRAVCYHDQPCRCCLAVEVEALRARVQAVRELYEFYRTSPVNECSQTDLLGEIARVLGGDA